MKKSPQAPINQKEPRFKMQEHQFASAGVGKYIAGLIILVVIVAAGYFGYIKVMDWHQKQVETAVKQKTDRLTEKTSELEKTVGQLKQQMEEETDTPEKRRAASAKQIEKVFGGPPEKPAVNTMEARQRPDCYRLEKKIDAFFEYLDRKEAIKADAVEGKGARRVFEEMVSALSAHPPMIIGETKDIVSLMHNQAHFFRILKKERIRLVKQILNVEAGVLEHAMGNFYDYYVKLGGCGGQDEAIVSLETLYEYASFFLDTLSGKSYLLRRESNIRCLTRYYSVLVLDQANKATLNRYGIDIRPHIELVLDDVRSQNSLIYQNSYIERLEDLEKKYNLN